MIQNNLLLQIFLAVFIVRSFIQVCLNWLNISYLRRHGTAVPEIFRDTIDPEKLKKISAYTVDSDHFHMIVTLVNQGILLILLLSGVLPWLAGTLSLWKGGPIVHGLIFFALLSLFTNLVSIPFSLYENFVIEARYGFNVMSWKTWVLDLCKSVAIGALMGGLLLCLLLILVIKGGESWWIWAWMMVGGFELLMMWIYPVVILPLFNKFDPVEDKRLEDHIRTLLEKAGLHTRGVFQMDASKRSKHTNAFFVGMGRTKRIVLFDTLLGSHTEEEILSVLAHEAGHWKKKHILRMLIPLEILSLVSFYVAAKLLNWPLLYQTFGFQETQVYVGLFLIGTFASLLSFFAQPLESSLSRRFEREADDFTLKLMGTGEPMCRALKRLAADNLANLYPYPLYSWFYYSHPPLLERILRLQKNNISEFHEERKEES